MPLRCGVRRALNLLVATLVLGALVGTSTSAPVSAEDARKERAKVQAQQAQVASQIDALHADQAHVADALATIDANVAAQQAVAADAGRAAEESAARAAAAQQAADQSAAELADLRARLTRFAVDAYVDPPGEALLRRFQAGSAQQDATKRAFLEMRSGHDSDLLDQVRLTQRRLEDEARRADEARAKAEADQHDAQAAVDSLTTARTQQEQFVDQVRARLDDRLADAAALRRLDAGLADRIQAEEAAVAAALARSAPPTPAPAAGSGGGGGGGGGGGSPAPAPGGGTAPTSPPSTRPSGPRPTPPPLRTVGGITVNAAIADRLQALLDAARADGVVLGGSGYRDMSSQIALRRQNCGTSDYAIWDMPPDQCSPPTARPGASMHEKGLAVDFTANGRFITSRTDPGFVWLAANAGRFGFANLPSEPWHWSTTGG